MLRLWKAKGDSWLIIQEKREHLDQISRVEVNSNEKVVVTASQD